MDQHLVRGSLLVIGTCTLARVINVIKQSEMDKISTSVGNCPPGAVVVMMCHNRRVTQR